MENEDGVKIGNPNLDNRGRFKKGNIANPNGRPKNAEPELLREALRKEGERRGIDFWDKVAQYAFRDKHVLIAIIKKFVPDKSNVELEGQLDHIIQIVSYKDIQGDIKSQSESQ